MNKNLHAEFEGSDSENKTGYLIAGPQRQGM